MADPERLDEMDEIIERYGEAQGRFEELDGYALEGRARESARGVELQRGHDGWRRWRAVGRLEDARGAGPHPSHAADAMLLDEPSNHLDLESLIWLETS